MEFNTHVHYRPVHGIIYLRRNNLRNSESVASLLGIVIDALNGLPYFLGPKLTTEGSHVGTGRIPSRVYRGNHTC